MFGDVFERSTRHSTFDASFPVDNATNRSGKVIISLRSFATDGFTDNWRGVRAVEGARLESVYTLIAYRGFESLPLRQVS